MRIIDAYMAIAVAIAEMLVLLAFQALKTLR